MRKIYSIIILILFFNIGILAQWSESDPIQYEMSRPQKENLSLSGLPSIKKVSVDVSGDFSFDIPLINVPGRKGLNFDINLTYSPGITVSQEAGMYGLGWDISIGAIKRIPGLDLDNHIKKIGDNSYMSQFRDLYSINCPGGNGTILQFPSVNNDFVFELEKFKNWQIIYEDKNDENPNNKDRFKIITEDGTIYVFGFLLKGLISDPLGYSATDAVIQPTTDPYLEWKLTAILSSDYVDGGGDPLDPLDCNNPAIQNKGSWVAIEYDENEFENDPNNNPDYAKWYVYVSNSKIVSASEVTYPYKVITPSYVAKFELETESRNSRNYQFYLNDGGTLVMPEISDVFVPDISMGNGHLKQRIKEIVLYKNKDGKGAYDNSPIKTVKFSYDDTQDRTTLKQLQFFSKENVPFPPFKFDYYNTFGEGKDLPHEYVYDPNCVDGAGSCTERIGRIGYDGYYNGEENFPEDGRIGTAKDGRAWNLKSISYPSGESITFDYEADYYYEVYSPLRYGRGVRLLYQKINDGHSTIKYEYSYESFKSDGSSAGNCGVLYASPLFYFNQHYPYNVQFPGFWRNGLRSSIGNRVLYGKITETNDANSGSISYYYDIRKTDVYRYYPNDSEGQSISDIFSKTLAQDGYLNKIEYKNSSNSIIKKEEFTRTYVPYNSYSIYSSNNPYYYFISAITNDETHTTTIYDPDGANGITTTVQTEYNNDGLVKKITETNSDNSKRYTQYRYPNDLETYTNTSGHETQAEYAAIEKLRSKHMLNAVIEKRITPDGTSANMCYSEFTRYLKADENRVYPADVRVCSLSTPGYYLAPWVANTTYSEPTLKSISGYTSAAAGPGTGNYPMLMWDDKYVVKQTFGFDDYGNPLQSTDANGNITKYAYGYNNSKLIGTAQNCGNANYEIGFDDFNDGSITDGDPHTWASHLPEQQTFENGALRINSGHANWGKIGYTNLTVDFTTKIISSDGIVGIQIGGSQAGINNGYFIDYSYNGNIELIRKGTYLVTSTPTYIPGNVWRRFSVTVKDANIKFYIDGSLVLDYTDPLPFTRNTSTDIIALHTENDAYVDDFRFYPAGAQATSYAYDPETLNLSETVDQNGASTYYQYDGFSRPIKKFALLEGRKALLEEYRYTYSRSVNDVYDVNRPNTKETVSFINSTGFSDFTSKDDWTVTLPTYATFNTFKNGEVCLKMSSPSAYNYQILSKTAGLGSYIAKTDFLADASTVRTAYVLMLETKSENLRASVLFYPSDKKFRVLYNTGSGWLTSDFFNYIVDLDNPSWYTVELEKTDAGEVYCFVYPKGEERKYATGYMYVVSGFNNATWNPVVASYTDGSSFYLSNFYVGKIDRTVEYLDGEGKTIQVQKQNGNKTVVLSTTEYDALGRPVKTYKPYEKNSGELGRLAYDATYYNSTTKTGSVVDYYKGLGAYNKFYPDGENPYSETSYYADPLNRTYQTGSPGSDWRIGSTHEKQFAYTGITDENDHEYFKTTSTDEQEISTDVYTDKFGNTVKTVQDPITSTYTTGLNLETKFTYDILGNLLSSTDPRGLTTSYTYNTLSQLLSKTSPDAGKVEYKYDKAGNLRFIKDANHAGTFTSVSKSGSATTSGSFTLNSWGRLYIVQNSAASGSAATISIKTNVSGNNAALYNKTVTGLDNYSEYIFLPKGTYQYTVTITGSASYSIASTHHKEFEYLKYDAFNRVKERGEYLSNSTGNFISGKAEDTAFPPSNRLANRWFYYDEPTSISTSQAPGQRNLKGKLSYSESYLNGSVFQRTFYSYDDLGRVEWIVQYFASGYNAKIKYNYDLQGKLVKKEYLQTNNNMYTFYEYDQMQRLTNVYTGTSSDGSNKVQEAAYTYNASGTVKRLQLANAQGVDYSYNSRDWLCAINHQNLNVTSEDPGLDAGAKIDKFGMVLGYNTAGNIGDPLYQNADKQYNGNISWIIYNISGLKYNNTYDLVGNTFSYDKANRLKNSNFGYWGASSWMTSYAYDMPLITYDNSGNINTLQRFGKDGIVIDNQTYHYTTGTNKLEYITDDQMNTYSSSDIDNQSPGNYAYDANGNMIQDLQNGVGFIYYDINNLPFKMCLTNGTVLEYGYDAGGNRTYNKPENRYYVNNASGANEAVGSSSTSTTISYNINGNGNIGMIDKIGTTYTKYYYLKDHLGSIRVRVNSAGSVIGWHDYYPFGMTMDGRDYTATNNDIYKYTGKERDAATKYDYFGARYYDGRIGRWLQVDPLSDKNPGLSVYNYCSNNPLILIDPFGTDTVYYGRMPEVTVQPAWEKATWKDASLHILSNVVYMTETDIYEYVYEVTTGEWWRRQNKIPPKVITGIVPGSFSDKPINLPSLKSISIDMEHIVSGHMIGGARTFANTKSLWPSSMTIKDVEQAIKSAYSTAKKVGSTGLTYTLHGVDNVSGLKIEMILMKETKTIRTAYPIE